MPSSDYTGVGGGLKLKGVKNAGVDKKRKKKSKDPKRGESSTSTSTATAEKDKDDSGGKDGESAVTRALREEDLTGAGDEGQAAMGGRPPKTEAERRHEEMRRKRVRFSGLGVCCGSH